MLFQNIGIITGKRKLERPQFFNFIIVCQNLNQCIKHNPQTGEEFGTFYASKDLNCPVP